jgi:cation diffusion facilitator family transporter
VAALLLSVTLLFGAYEVAMLAYDRLLHPSIVPEYSLWGVSLMAIAMLLSLFLSQYESAQSKKLASPFLTSDSLHNMSDFVIGFAGLATLVSFKFKVPYVDAITALLITIYLCFLSIKLLRMNFNPLVDGSVLDPLKVIQVAESTEGVMHCHNVRSRGDGNHLFLDLNIHLPGNISLHKAHEITHNVEARLKAEFPGLMDVVIHTEPHDHPPCSKG